MYRSPDIYLSKRDRRLSLTKKTNKLIFQNKLQGHTRTVQHLRYSSKYKYIFSAAMDNKLLVWNPYVKHPIISVIGRLDVK